MLACSLTLLLSSPKLTIVVRRQTSIPSRQPQRYSIIDRSRSPSSFCERRHLLSRRGYMDGGGGPPHSRTKQRRPKPGGGQQNCRPSTHGEQRNKSGTQMPSPLGPAVHLNPGQQVRSIPPHVSPNRAQNRDWARTESNISPTRATLEP